MIDVETVNLTYTALSAALKRRIETIRESGKADSLFQAYLSVNLSMLDQQFRTLIEAIEDADSL